MSDSAQFEFTAALQAAQSCGGPILLRAADVGGHFGNPGPDSWMEDAADALAFVGRQVGMGVGSPGLSTPDSLERTRKRVTHPASRRERWHHQGCRPILRGPEEQIMLWNY